LGIAVDRIVGGLNGVNASCPIEKGGGKEVGVTRAPFYSYLLRGAGVHKLDWSARLRGPYVPLQ
jgi:hypothetical protein